MKKVRDLLMKYIHPICIIFMAFLIIACIFIIYNSDNSEQEYVSETWVRDYLTAYSDNLTELDIQILEKNLSTQIDEKIGEMDFETDLSEEQLIELMAMINEELQYADFSISQEELSSLSAVIVKRIISENLLSVSEINKKYLMYEKEIDNLEKQLTVLRSTLEKLSNDESDMVPEFNYSYNSSLTEDQVREIAKDTGIDEEIVKNWISELKISFQDDFDELAKILDTDKETLIELSYQAKESTNSINYLAKRLGITEEKLNDALSQINVSGNQEFLQMINSLRASQEQLKEQVEENFSLTSNSISSVQSQVTANKNAATAAIAESKTELNSTIAANKSELDTTIAENKEETDKKIYENKEYTDNAIEELQTNVLYYQYDEKTNTLHLFEKPEEEITQE